MKYYDQKVPKRFLFLIGLGFMGRENFGTVSWRENIHLKGYDWYSGSFFNE